LTLHSAAVALHLLVIALGLGFSVSNFINTRIALSNDPDFAKGLALHRRTIARFGDAVIALIWITGLLLIWLNWPLSLSSAFHVKMLFVVVLTLLHGYGRSLGEKMRREASLANLPRLSGVIGGVGLCATAALLCAVLAFRT
jgi:uncharacterized membrane protein